MELMEPLQIQTLVLATTTPDTLAINIGAEWPFDAHTHLDAN